LYSSIIRFSHPKPKDLAFPPYPHKSLAEETFAY